MQHLLSTLLLPFLAVAGLAQDSPDFAAEIRPLLSRNCFACHGPDEGSRAAGLRLDLREGAVAERESGAAVVPGDRASSRAWVRTGDADDPMPPVETGHALSAEERESLGRWIDAGAEYAQHWAFVAPVIGDEPAVSHEGWVREGLDRFVLAALEERGMAPGLEADRWTLARRVSLDLIGLPPSFEQAREFVEDERSDAYERYVDGLLASPRYGERWAAMWLDLARYADSMGLGSDPLRQIWRYRDWVIEAYNRNLPYDEFIVEQLAGDLLPGATLEQRLATAFHRNTMNNTEGGTDNEEWRVAAVKDRTNTTMQAFMGVTAGCASCHSHKFDPISQSEYYSLFAFFNQTADADRNDDSPRIETPTREQVVRKAELQTAWEAALLPMAQAGPWSELAELPGEGEGKALALPDGDVTGLRVSGVSLKEVELSYWPGPAGSGPLLATELRISLPGKGRILSLAEVELLDPEGRLILGGEASQSSEGFGGKVEYARDGNRSGNFDERSVTHTAIEAEPWWSLRFEEAQRLAGVRLWNRTGGLESRLKDAVVEVFGEGGELLAWTVLSTAPMPDTTISWAAGPRSLGFGTVLELGEGQGTVWPLLRPLANQAGGQISVRWLGKARPDARFMASADALLAPDSEPRRQLAATRRALDGFSMPMTPVMVELAAEKRRSSHVLYKGNFLMPGDEVQAAVPEALHSMPDGAAMDRLGLARWVASERNPLTARVAVNRIWARLFGRGLVRTEENFGNQGDAPSHAALLDHLAVEFMADGWDQKRLLRRLVSSATYRQASSMDAQAVRIDPENIWIGRGPRVRLEAEMVRDVALSVSGLLTDKLGGRSIFPPQPDGLWQAAFNGQRSWVESQGPDRYRRGLYVFLRRSTPYPAMDTFDVPSRDVCATRRIATNTPLQAFVTLNDPAFVECARALAVRMLAAGERAEERAAFGLREALGRPADAGAVQVIAELVRSEQASARSGADAQRLAVGMLASDVGDDEYQELAAWTVAAGVLLNLDAVLTKE
ncbi:MAG: hypothetical protein ACI8QC_001847 [Planctomycetota bacterium]